MRSFFNRIKILLHKEVKFMKLELRYALVVFFMVFLLTASLLYIALNPKGSGYTSRIPKYVSYLEFNHMVYAGKVKSVKLDLNDADLSFTDDAGRYCVTENPKSQDFKLFLLEHNIAVSEQSSNQTIIGNVVALAPVLICVLFFAYMVRHTARGITEVGDVMMRKVPRTDITFNDVAGIDESKDELINLIKFLKNAESYNQMGAKLPKGVIFYGPPGTGKTLCAKAIAGEAGVPFYSMSGSDFVEVYVGVGAKRIRQLFSEAKKNTPCIIFIDELDAIGGKRGINQNSERDQTINALLTEMDGFNGKEGIIVIAATNRLELLDEALIRPGRFDRHIAIGLPDLSGRIAILKVHTANKRLAESIKLEQIAKLTIGFSGAALNTLVNEAAIIAVDNGHDEIQYEDIDDAYYKLVMQGSKKRNMSERTKEEMKLVAWHEAGHALVTKLITRQSVPKVTIISSTSGAGGVTFITPDKISLYTKEDLLNRIKIAYAGRASEYILLKDESKITVGAANDIKNATSDIVSMLKNYGMTSRIGLLNLDEMGIANDELILKEAQELSNKCYNEVLSLMQDNEDILESIANMLIANETLVEEDLDRIIRRCA